MAKTPVDLSKYDAAQKRQEEGIEVKVVDPTGNDTGIVLRMAGPDSKLVKDAIATVRAEAVAEGKLDAPDAAAQYARETRVLSLTTLGCTAFMLDGEEHTFSAESVAKLYTRFPFIREQAKVTVENRYDFFVEPKKDAPPQ
jgi:hypothetical protein